MEAKNRKGQSLAEVLVAVTLGGVIILAVMSIIVPAIRSNTAATSVQSSAALGRELLGNVRVWSQSNWSGISALATSSANKYFLLASSSPFNVSSGQQTVTVGTSTYSRYFYLDDVYRDYAQNDKIVTSGGTYDGSTKRVTVVYGPSGGATSTIFTYVSRFRHSLLIQTDWSGGAGQTGVVSSVNSQFSSSSNINYSTTTGSFRIDGL